MIVRPPVPVAINQQEQVKPRTLKHKDYANTVARWNRFTRQWEFGNGQIMDCAVFAGNTFKSNTVAEG